MEDTQTGCFLRLARANFSDCSDLRRAVLAIQNHLTPAVFLSRGGDITNLSKADFFHIISPVWTSAPNISQNSGTYLHSTHKKGQKGKCIVNFRKILFCLLGDLERNATAQVKDNESSSNSNSTDYNAFSPFWLSQDDLPTCNSIPSRLHIQILFTR